MYECITAGKDVFDKGVTIDNDINNNIVFERIQIKDVQNR